MQNIVTFFKRLFNTDNKLAHRFEEQDFDKWHNSKVFI